MEILELGVFIFINIAMFVVKLTDLIPENKLVNGKYLQNCCPDDEFDISNKTSSDEDHFRV